MTPAAPPPPGRQTVGVLLVLLSAAAFAVGPTAARLAFDAGANAPTVVAARGVIGVALMAALVAASGGAGFRMRGRTLARCLLAGLASTLVSYGFIGSVAHIPVGLAVLVFFTHPVLVAAMWHLEGRERLTPRKLALALAALLGVALALGAASLGDLDATGIALAALASLAMCGTIRFGSRAAEDGATSAGVNLYATAVTVGVFVPAATAFDAWAFPSGLVGWLGLVASGVGITVGLVAFLAAFRFLGPVRATMLSNVEPLLAVLLAAALLGERLGPAQWAGVLLVAAALALFEWPSGERRGGDAPGDAA